MTAWVTVRTQKRLCVRLQLLEDHCAKFPGVCRILPSMVTLCARAHFPLDAHHGPIRIGDGLTLCRLTDHTLAGLWRRRPQKGWFWHLSGFVMTMGSPPSYTATQEFVVPKSIPIIFPIIYTSFPGGHRFSGCPSFIFCFYVRQRSVSQPSP